MTNNLNNRILLKISGESLVGNSEFGIDVKKLDSIAQDIKEVYDNKYQIKFHE